MTKPRSYTAKFVQNPAISLSAAMLDLVTLSYAATTDFSRWQELVDAYLSAIGSSRGYVLLNAGSRNQPVLVRCSSWCDEDARSCADRYLADTLHSRTGMRMGPAEGAVRTIDLACHADVSPPSRSCRKVNELRDIRYEVSGVFLDSAHTCSAIVAVRSEREGPFVEPAFAVLRSLLPHLRRATLLQSELLSLRAQLAAFTAYLDRYPYPLLLTDPRGCITYANAAAMEIAALNDGLTIASGQLSFLSPRDQIAYTKGLEQVTADTGPALCRLEAQRRSRKSPFTLLLLPVACSNPMPMGFPRSAVSVLIIDREAEPAMDPAILRVVFSLTETEARVTAKLGGGWSAEQIAKEMGISLETARTHIRHILSKTATARQGELISLVLRTTPFRIPLKRSM